MAIGSREGCAEKPKITFQSCITFASILEKKHTTGRSDFLCCQSIFIIIFNNIIGLTDGIYLNSPFCGTSITFICLNLQKTIESKWRQCQHITSHSQKLMGRVFYILRDILWAVIHCIKRINFGDFHQRTIRQPGEACSSGRGISRSSKVEIQATLTKQHSLLTHVTHQICHA